MPVLSLERHAVLCNDELDVAVLRHVGRDVSTDRANETVVVTPYAAGPVASNETLDMGLSRIHERPGCFGTPVRSKSFVKV